MRKLFVTSLLLAFSLVIAPASALAGQSSQTITATFNTVQFSSILGGMVTGTAVADGAVTDLGIGALRGSANLPLRDQKLSLEPTGVLALTPQQVLVSWWLYQCDGYGCTYFSGLSTFERSFAQGPVDIRLGTMRGNGSLTLSTDAVCTAACPPPGANYYPPTGGITVTGGIIGSQDAGNVFMNGPAPIIR